MSRSSSHTAKTPVAQFLSTTWHALRENDEIPLRRHFTPRLMADYLPDIFVLHHKSAKGIQFRLAGTRLCARHGQELRHQSFSSLWPENHQVEMEEMLHSVADNNKPLCAQLSGISYMQRVNEFELILIPILHQDETQWLGAIATQQEPYWLIADPIHYYHLKKSFLITHDNLQATKMQVNAAKYASISKSPRKKPAFRIIQGGKP